MAGTFAKKNSECLPDSDSVDSAGFSDMEKETSYVPLHFTARFIFGPDHDNILIIKIKKGLALRRFKMETMSSVVKQILKGVVLAIMD